MSKDRQATSDKVSEGPQPRIAMSLKPVNLLKPGSAISSESWLASLAKLAAKMSTAPPHPQNSQA